MQKKTKTQKANEYSPEFLEFWEHYPFRRGSKWDAFRSWEKVVGRIVPASEVIAAARRFAAVVVRRQTEARFVPHAATWLNGRRWETIEELEREPDPQPAGSGEQGRQTAEEFTRSSVEEWLRGFHGDFIGCDEQTIHNAGSRRLGASPG